MPRATAFAALVLALLQAFSPLPAFAQALESVSVAAAKEFENPVVSPNVVDGTGAVIRASPAKMPDKVASGLGAAGALKSAGLTIRPPTASQLDVIGPGGVPRGGGFATGIGPVSRNANPGYLKGLLGGLLGLVLAPIAFAAEVVQAVAFTPVRMIKGLINGDPLALLEPIRTVKNLAQDAIMTAGGMLNCATAPVWNAFRPDQSTDFQYANNRLIFQGGPVGGIHEAMGWAAMAPSWHTVFMTGDKTGYSVTEHEFVHNKQWQRSFAWEHVGEDYYGYKGWNRNDAHEYLNW